MSILTNAPNQENQDRAQPLAPLPRHMKVALIEVRPIKNEYIAKEMAGGLGKRIRLGGGVFSNVLNRYLTSLFNAPPIILASLAGVCRQMEHQAVSYHTADTAEIDPATDVAIVLASMVDYHNELNFMKALKEKLPKVKLIVVGSFASAMPQIFSAVVDCVVTGDPEAAVQRIFREGFPSEKIVHSQRPDNLNELPMLDWTPFIQKGYYARRPFGKELGISIQKSRGCSMTCNYCPYAAFYGKARQFDSDYVLKMIEHYYHNHNIRYFMFRDPNFGENRKDFQVFMQKLIDSQLKFHWSCEARLDTFKDDDLTLMAKAGLKYLITGVESSDEELLKANLRRAYKKEDAYRRIDILEKAGVIVQTNFIIGFPHETEKSVRDTIEYAKKLNSMFATFHVFTPQPGTKIFENYRDKLLGIDWEDFTYSNLVWQHDTLSKEFLDGITSKAYIEYYFRPQWIAKHALRLARILL